MNEKEYLQSLLTQGILEERGDDYVIRKPFTVERQLFLNKTLLVPSDWTMRCGDKPRFYPTKDEEDKDIQKMSH